MKKQKLLRITTVSLSLDSLLKGQLSYLNKEYEVVGLASGIEKLREVTEREGIRTIEVKMKRDVNLWADLQSLFALIKIIAKEKPYIVHANTPKGSLLAMVAAWVCRVPHRIYTVTGLRFETTKGRFRWILITMEKITCWCATKVIPEGEGVKNTLLREKITKKPLQKILNGNINGIDLDYFQRTEAVTDDAATLQSELFTFCFVGRMVKDKGTNELVRAFARLQNEHKHIRLLLVGPLEQHLDPLEEEVLMLINSHPAITYAGSKKDIRPYLAASDALAFPSYREGFPNVVMQAGAMGLPSIVTDINGCNEIIIEGVNGIIIPPKNEEALYKAMKYFIDNKAKVAEMAAHSRPLIASRYEQKMVWEAILKEYQSL